MSTIIGLLVAAFVLVFFEVILPGGVLGVLAALCLILATWIAGVQFGAGVAILTFVGSAIAIALLVYIEFRLLARTSLGQAFFLKSSVSGHSNTAPAEASIVGQDGIALTRLNPSGKVAIDGQAYEAYSQDGYIDADQPIHVVSQDNFKLIIKKL
ncbi:NfeD family protein [Coraliomargarita sp. SDUM461004]|uniref:NfeD family protein n=1 Tax=Thalassobacterium sedimentorum TaxID=3041258 RepID=A0ABU1ALG7_9BACT|nr:NfeD family protein [Coraliomargarita sp. SDUM461004]MDQ8194438.1 NfeD family protein [Coraliomargarita sp. SDUM461004]